jgi:hypothetical protein
MEQALIRMIKQIKIEPVKLIIDNVWVGFPAGYTERHLAKFTEINELRTKLLQGKKEQKKKPEFDG